MLKEVCQSLIIGINKLTEKICEYEFLIDEEFNYKIKKGNCVYNIENASGAEKLVLNISFRIIISGIHNISRMIQKLKVLELKQYLVYCLIINCCHQ